MAIPNPNPNPDPNPDPNPNPNPNPDPTPNPNPNPNQVADGDDEATASLLSAGANVNHLSKQYDWASPTILAAQEGSLDCLRLLLAVRTEPNPDDPGAGTLLAEVDRADRFGMTAAHMAAYWDNHECLHALLEAGSDVSLRAKGAGTAAHQAVARDSEASLQVLLEHGVRQRLATGLPHDAMLVDAVDRDGRNVYELAVQSGSERCVARLDEWEEVHRPAAKACSAAAGDGTPHRTGELEALQPAADARV